MPGRWYYTTLHGSCSLLDFIGEKLAVPRDYQGSSLDLPFLLTFITQPGPSFRLSLLFKSLETDAVGTSSKTSHDMEIHKDGFDSMTALGR